jgi:hypothetical protein
LQCEGGALRRADFWALRALTQLHSLAVEKSDASKYEGYMGRCYLHPQVYYVHPPAIVHNNIYDLFREHANNTFRCMAAPDFAAADLVELLRRLRFCVEATR